MPKEVTFPYAVTASAPIESKCALCELVAPWPGREEDGQMYWAMLSQRTEVLICKPHAVDCGLVTEEPLVAQPGAEAAAILHLRGEDHRTDKCPLPHGEVDDHCSTVRSATEGLSHRETGPAANWEERTREASSGMSPDEVLVVEHVRNRHRPGAMHYSCAACSLQQRLDSIIEG